MATTPSLKQTDWSIYRRLLRYVAPMWPVFAIAVVGFALGNGAEAYFVRLFGDLVDVLGNDTPDADAYWVFPALMITAVLVRGLGEFTGEFFLARISYRLVHTLRTQLFGKLLVLPSAFFDRSSHGHLVSRVTFNVAQLRDTATDALKTVIQDGSKVAILLGAMFYENWRLTLIFMAIVPVVAVVVGYASRRFRRISQRIQNSMGDVTQVAGEAVTGYRVVRIFGGEEYERGRFDSSSDYNRRQNLKMVATKASSTQVIQIFVAVALGVLVSLLFRPEIAGGMQPGDVVYFVGLAALLARPIRTLSEVNAKLQRGLAAAEDIFYQIDQGPEADQGNFATERAEGRIEFRNVSFSYERTKGPVLKNLSFVIEPGQTVALVGRSGSGKTTLASLIARFYEADSGEIRLDGERVSAYSLASLRDQIALVTQHVTLFNDSLRRNIAYGRLAARSDEDVRDAIHRAHADAFIDELPAGLDTMVGENGVLLSGGQRQRVAIARALLKDAPILILDEATSALDTESEKHIRAALEEVMRGRTTIVIAHRLSTVESADVIMVMDDGGIVESGSHESLLAEGGTYAALYDSQFNAPAEKTRHKRAPVPPVRPHSTGGGTGGLEQAFNPLVRAWYADRAWPKLLRPLAWLYRRVTTRRRLEYLTGKREPWRAPVPVVVVGNVTAGGTGKSPLVIYLASWLTARGMKCGIVTRGHGGRGTSYPLDVGAQTSAEIAGDEAPMLAFRTRCPVVADPDRVRALEHLLESHDVDIVLSDDGLQHYALARDVEIAVLDGYRGVGNGLCLPAGPLRETLERLRDVDLVVANGRATGLVEGELVMHAEPRAFVNLRTGERRDTAGFDVQAVHAVAGIGNPARFHQTLSELGLDVMLHAYPDHYVYRPDDLLFGDETPVIVTEKDAVKIRRLPIADLPRRCWYLEIDMVLPGEAEVILRDTLTAHGIRLDGAAIEAAG